MDNTFSLQDLPPGYSPPHRSMNPITAGGYSPTGELPLSALPTDRIERGAAGPSAQVGMNRGPVTLDSKNTLHRLALDPTSGKPFPPITLLQKEAAIFRTLLQHPEKVFSSQQLQEVINNPGISVFKTVRNLNKTLKGRPYIHNSRTDDRYSFTKFRFKTEESHQQG